MTYTLVRIDVNKQRKIALEYTLFGGIVFLVALYFFPTEGPFKIFFVLFCLPLLLFLLFSKRWFSKNISIQIKQPFSLQITEEGMTTNLDNIQKWNFSAVPKQTYVLFKFINDTKKYKFYIEGKYLSNFINDLKKEIKAYNSNNDVPIINLEKEFHQSKTSKAIFISLYLINFIFLILIFVDYLGIKFAVCLAISMFITLYYGVIRIAAKNQEV